MKKKPHFPHSFYKLRIPKESPFHNNNNNDSISPKQFKNKKAYYPNTFRKTYTIPKFSQQKNKNKCYNSATYYKDPFFLNETNLKIQLQILREINKDDFNFGDYSSETNRENFKIPLINHENFKLCKTIKNESDDYFFRRVFKMKPLFRKKKPIVDNKFNMRYAENEEQYLQIIEKEKKILKAQGKPIKKKNVSELINLQVNDIKEKIRFMKGVTDFTYPGYLLAKIKAIDKILKQDNLNKIREFYSPATMRDKEIRKRNNDRKKFLYQCIDIKKNPVKKEYQKYE